MSETLPRGWRKARVRDVADACLGKMLDRNKHTNGSELPYLRNQNVRWFEVDTSDVQTMFFEEDELHRFGLQDGDLLICEGGEPGRAAIWRGGGTAMKFQKALHRVRPDAQALLPEWLMFQLFLDAKSGLLEERFTGTTIKHFTGTALAGYELRLPPLPEQRRIVAKLEALQARSRRAKEALDTVPALLEQLRQSILAAAFRGDLTKDWRAANPNVEPASELLKRIRAERRAKWEEAELAKLKAKGKTPSDDKWKAKYKEPEPVDASGLPELPAGWCWATVEEAGEVDLGRMRSPDNHRGENVRPYLRVKNVYEDRIDVRDVMDMHFEPDEFEFYRLVPGDILLNEGQSKELVGRPAMFRGELPAVAFTNSLIRFRPFGGAPPEYALALFRHYLHSGRFQQIAQITTNIAHLGASRLRSLEYPLPPRAEQVALADAVRQRLDAVLHLVDRLSRVANVAGELESAVLAKAFRGELVPQEPSESEEEPAPVPMVAERNEPARRGRKPRS